MRRIRLAVVFAVGLFLVPLTTEPQQPRTVRIGYLSGNPASDTQSSIDAFRRRLQDLGYREGQELRIEYRYAEGKYERLPELAEDLVRLKMDVIFTYGTPGSIAAKNATRTIPIVFGAVADPLAAGLVTSLARPGANITGVTTNNPDLSAKRMSLLKEALPGASRVAVLANPDFPPTPKMVTEARLAASALGIKVQVLQVRTPAELEKAFGAMTTAKSHAVMVLPDAMFIAERRQIVELASRARIPAMYHLWQFVEAGGLICYGVDYVESFQQAAGLVDKIVKGAKPAELPVEQPWRFALAINLKTAKALGLTIPPSVLGRADQVVE